MLPLAENLYLQWLVVGIGVALAIPALIASLRFWRRSTSTQAMLVDRINALLPQTQCGQCSYEGCLPYAKAIARGAAINQCPPGGATTIVRLARLLNDYPQPLNPAHGIQQSSLPGTLPQPLIAVIREDECIGCTKCIKACPVDAILGGPKLMHTVLSSECTGCDLCVAPCPVDCIDMLPRPESNPWRWQLPSQIHTADFPLGRPAAKPIRTEVTHSRKTDVVPGP